MADEGHVLMLAPFTDGSGLVVICSACGHPMTTNRQSKLHTEKCKPGFANNPGARAAWTRVSRRLHPKHSEGDGQVLEPLLPWSPSRSRLACPRERACCSASGCSLERYRTPEPTSKRFS